MLAYNNNFQLARTHPTTKKRQKYEENKIKFKTQYIYSRGEHQKLLCVCDLFHYFFCSVHFGI